jgi:hypothetical protein
MYSEELRWSGKAVAILFGSILGFDLLVLAPALFDRDTASGVRMVATILGITTAILVLVLLVFGKLRSAVEIDSVVTGFGPFKDRIPFSDIRSVAAVTYRFMDFGGWGLRLGRRGKMYNVPGDDYRAVEITKSDGKRVLFSSRDPEAFARAIEARLPARVGLDRNRRAPQTASP